MWTFPCTHPEILAFLRKGADHGDADRAQCMHGVERFKI